MSGIMFDLDGDHFYHSRSNHIEHVDEKHIVDTMLQYKDTDITDFVLCINGSLSSTPSKIKTTYAEKYLRTEEYGKKVDYTDTCAKTAYHVWNVLGLDLYKIWIDTLRSIDINPWLSFRMNDVHNQLDPLPNFGQSDFFYDHVDEYARVHGRKPEFYFDRARDWLIEDVRKEMYDYMEEQLNAYDPYGIVLDFQREFICFPPGREDEGRAVMTDFIRSVKVLVTKMEEKYSHKIKIALRCQSDPLCCYELGFDIVGYAREGLIDMFVASPRFRSTDTNMPIAYWKQLLEPYGVEIAGAAERMIQPYPNAPLGWNSDESFQTVETHMGTAAGIFAQGADKYYVFNTFDEFEQLMSKDCGESNKIYRSAAESPEDGTLKKGTYTLFANGGSPEKISKRVRKCISTFSDSNPIWKKQSGQLPVELTEGSQPYYIKINTGKISDSDKAYVGLGVSGDYEKLSVSVNDSAAEFIQAEECTLPLSTKNKVLKYLIPQNAYAPCGQVIEIIYRGRDKLTIDYADIVILP